MEISKFKSGANAIFISKPFFRLPVLSKKLQLNLNYHKYLSPSNAELLTAMDLLERAGGGFAFGLPWKIYRVVGGITGIVIRGSNLPQMEVGLAGLLRAGDSS